MAYFGTTTPLAANAQVILGPTQTDRADNLAGLIFASHACTLFIEQSGDGTNWDLSRSIAVSATTGTGFSEPLYGGYVRLRILNGGTTQTALRTFARFTSAGDS
jgi:hypothetical protein